MGRTGSMIPGSETDQVADRRTGSREVKVGATAASVNALRHISRNGPETSAWGGSVPHMSVRGPIVVNPKGGVRWGVVP
ncbi:hypothetical protein GCM10009540_19710 [Streptomyces turgidiscabies]